MRKKLFILISATFCLFLISLPCVAPGGERFIDNGDGTVSDTLTNLMWSKEDNLGDINWHDAKVYCNTPPISGYKYLDWRMPTIKELRTLYNKDTAGYETDCGLRARIDPAIRLSCAWVWASGNKTISAYAFSFRKGYQYSTLKLNKKLFRALPVRNIK
ncbi:MAG: DUF1566 domain-containing protein [Syntrophobacterales bacterium]|nr:DUF1566 domain-containing protein [Syntrophobacterales bacterium]